MSGATRREGPTAAGLGLRMVGVTGLTAAGVGGGTPEVALFPTMVGLLAALVAYGRWRVAPHRGSARVAALQPTV